jgi:hypothetical protein
MRSDPSGAQARPLLSGSGHPRELVTDGQVIYFWNSSGDGTSNGSLMRVLTTGSGFGLIADVQTHDAGRLALDDAFVYWSSPPLGLAGGQVLSVSRVGGTPSLVASGLQAPHSVWLTPSALYWSDHSEGSVRRADTGAGQVVLQGQGAAEIDGDSSYLVLAAEDAGEIRELRLIDGLVAAPATGQLRPRFVRYDQGTIWYANQSTDGTWAVMKLQEGADPLVVASSSSISELAQDSVAIYWADLVQGLILKVAK